MDNLKSNAATELEGWSLWEAPFYGFRVREDASVGSFKKYFPNGFNVRMTKGGEVETRDGWEAVGAVGTSTANPVTSQWTFIRRDGTEIMMRADGTSVRYFHPTLETWHLLQTVTTANRRFGRAPIVFNNDALSREYFCNGGTGGADDMYSWSGAIAQLGSTTATTITVSGSSTVATLGFTTASGSVIINGTTYAYTGTSGNDFTGVTPDPTGEAATSAIAQIPVNETTDNSAPSGNILLADDSRLLVAGISAAESEIRASNLATSTPLSWTVVARFAAARAAGDPRRIELPFGNGAITALVKDIKSIFAFHPYALTAVNFTDPYDRTTSGTAGSAIFAGDDVQIKPLKPYDNKSQASGATSMQSVCAAGDGIVCITNDHKILYLKSVAQLLSPETASIGDTIQPLLNTMQFNRSCSIVFRSQLYIACRSSEDVTRNDTVIVYDLLKNEWVEFWSGVAVSDFCIYDNELHWGSDNTNTSFKQITDKTDAGLGFSTFIATHIENFGIPHRPKKVDRVWLEGELNETGEIDITVLYDREGVSGSKTVTLSGDDRQVFNTSVFNLFGNNPFAFLQFGSNPTVNNRRPFKVEIKLKPNIAAYEYQLTISSSRIGTNCKITRFGYRRWSIVAQLEKIFKGL